MVTVSAALNEGLMTPQDLIDTNPGSVKLEGRKAITEAHGKNYGVLSLEDVLIKSSNVGAIRIGDRVGSARLWDYIHRFGFDEKLGQDFPGQSKGQLGSGPLNDSSRASISMGYQIGVTPLQMVTAASVIANGGVLMEPHVVRALTKDGVRKVTAPKELRRVVLTRNGRHDDSNHGRRGLAWDREGRRPHTVPSGWQNGNSRQGGERTLLPDRLQRVVRGLCPVEQPALTILVVVDTPKKGPLYGGTIAAPVFKRVAEASLQQLGVAPSINPAPPIISASPSLLPAPARRFPDREPVITRVGGRPSCPT
jgi:cell division protein FtsI/penicillin-binding protein 2